MMNRLTPSRLNSRQPNPSSWMKAARRPRQPAVTRACRKHAYTTQVMKAQVSVGSQPQYRPQAWSAQIAPAMMPKVQIGNANTTVR